MMAELPEEVKNLKLKVSGCPNSCGQHHISDLGFYGVSRKSGSYTVPHFQLVLGGQWKNNGGSYGLAVAAVPSKRIPETVKRLTDKYVKERQKDETFQNFVQRIGKVEIKNLLSDLMVIPSHDAEPGFSPTGAMSGNTPSPISGRANARAKWSRLPNSPSPPPKARLLRPR